jgi:hypothetical protein
VENADGVHALADPGEDDLHGNCNRDAEREQNAPLAEPSPEGKQQEDEGAEKDEVAEGDVKAEAVVEHFLADQLVLVRAFLVGELLRSVESSVRCTCDLGDDGQEEKRNPVEP